MKPTIKVQSKTTILGGKFSWPPFHVNDQGRGNLNESKLTWRWKQTPLCVSSYFPRFFQLINVWRSIGFCCLVSWVYFKIERYRESQAQVNFHSCLKLNFNFKCQKPLIPVSYVSTSQSTMEGWSKRKFCKVTRSILMLYKIMLKLNRGTIDLTSFLI